MMGSPGDDAAAAETFQRETEQILEVAVESAVSVLQERLVQAGKDGAERRVRTYIQIKGNSGSERTESSGGKSAITSVFA